MGALKSLMLQLLLYCFITYWPGVALMFVTFYVALVIQMTTERDLNIRARWKDRIIRNVFPRRLSWSEFESRLDVLLNEPVVVEANSATLYGDSDPRLTSFVKFYERHLMVGGYLPNDTVLADSPIANAIRTVFAEYENAVDTVVSAVPRSRAVSKFDDDTVAIELTSHFGEKSSHAGDNRRVCSPEERRFFSYLVTLTSTPALKEAVERTSKILHEHSSSLEYVLTPGNIVSYALTPMTALVCANALWAAGILGVTAYRVTYNDACRSSSDRFQALYFVLFNSGTITDLVIICFYRCLLLQQSPHRSPFMMFSVLLVLPGLITNVVPGLILYAWIFLPLIAATVGFEWILRRGAQRVPMEKYLAHFAIGATSRFVVAMTAAVILSLAYNYAMWYVWRVEESIYNDSRDYAYFAVIQREYERRSIVCVINEMMSHAVTLMQNLGSIGGPF